MGADETPPTLRSAGVAPKAPPSPSLRRRAWASYEVTGNGRALVEVAYLGAPHLYSFFSLEIRQPLVTAGGVDPLYEAAYMRAAQAARVHGFDLDRFPRSQP